MELPPAVLWYHMDPKKIPESLQGAPTIRLGLTNELSDPAAYPMGLPSKPKRKPLLPGGEA